MKKDYLHHFIFSNKPVFRLQRHSFFWLVRLLSLAACETFYESDVKDTFNVLLHRYVGLLPIFIFNIILLEMAYCYFIVYYLVPKYLVPKKYRAFLVTVALSTLLILILANCMHYLETDLMQKPAAEQITSALNITRLIMIFGAPTIAVFFLLVKLFKTWYQKQKEKQLLLQANADMEIQLLKAQIHPHFLFNTLNNIYSYTLDYSPKAGELVLQLTEMMKYMITECNTDMVPLKKELLLIKDYTGLERVRYGNQLNFDLEITGDDDGKFIAPLLMIPFVENAFKHGASMVLEDPWVKLKIHIGDNMLHFNLANSRFIKPDNTGNKGGIGLRNVEKRLQLIYGDRQNLRITKTNTSFYVEMQVPLYLECVSAEKAESKTEKALVPNLKEN